MQPVSIVAPSRADIEGWPPAERARVARVLDDLVERPSFEGALRVRRRVILSITAGGVLVLAGWIAFLTATLPETTSVGAWRTAWVGFDVVLIAVLGLSAWLVLRRRQLALTGLTVAATMLFVDAWFDVCLSWGTRDQLLAIVTAACVELPIFAVLAATVATVLRQSCRIAHQLRGDDPRTFSMWRQPVILVGRRRSDPAADSPRVVD